MDTPVLFLVFNRPDTTRFVFEAIRKARPSRLYVAADGARPDRDEEVKKCAEVRRISTEIDWPCEIHTLFRDTNLGCKKAVSEAITWFFKLEPEGIILEDDCIPDPSFFVYCSELLEKYRNEPRIMALGGNYLAFNEEKPEIDEFSYFYTRHIEIWGWATWRRAWDLYDPQASSWGELPADWLLEIGDNNRDFKEYWTKIFNSVYNNQVDTWDFQWVFTVWYNNGLSILPTKNLVTNIGFNGDATHTKLNDGFLDSLPLQKMEFPLISPLRMEKNKSMDKWLDKAVYGVGSSFIEKVLKRILRAFKSRMNSVT